MSGKIHLWCGRLAYKIKTRRRQEVFWSSWFENAEELPLQQPRMKKHARPWESSHITINYYFITATQSTHTLLLPLSLKITLVEQLSTSPSPQEHVKPSRFSALLGFKTSFSAQKLPWKSSKTLGWGLFKVQFGHNFRFMSLFVPMLNSIFCPKIHSK